MRIEIDTKNKIIQLEESVNIAELFVFLEGLLPNYKEYTLEPVIKYNSQPPYREPLSRPFDPTVIYETGQPHYIPNLFTN